MTPHLHLPIILSGRMAAFALLALLPGLAAAQEDCREITHAAGTTCVPLNPQRIVSLDATTSLPVLLELGAPVVGAVTSYPGDTTFPDYVPVERLDGITIVGHTTEFNLEAILALEPDLIVGDDYFSLGYYDELTAIAPTLITEYGWYRTDWDQIARRIAAAIGQEAAFGADYAQLQAEIAAVAARFEAEGRSPVLSRLDVYEGLPMYHRFDCVWFGPVIHALGVTQPAAQRDGCDPTDPYTAFAAVSPEELISVFSGGDALLVYSHDQAGVEDIVAEWPLWPRLDTVAAGEVFFGSDAWGVGNSIAAARRLVQDIDRSIFPPLGQ